MEKVIYALWPKEGEGRHELNRRLQLEAAPKLLELSQVRGLRLNLQDEATTPAEPLRQIATDPQMDAVVQIWMNSANERFRDPIDSILRDAAGRIGAWLVVESTIIPNMSHPPVAGRRTQGWSQFVFLLKPEQLTHDQWRHNWQVLHTPVAIDTQANFEYVQHPVVRTLIEGPLPYVAMVEECFPAEAMTDSPAFFDAVGDPAKFEANTKAMAESCARFIGAGGVDVLLTSQYEFRAPTAAATPPERVPEASF